MAAGSSVSLCLYSPRILISHSGGQVYIWNWQTGVKLSQASATLDKMLRGNDGKVVGSSTGTVKYFYVSAANNYVELWSSSTSNTGSLLLMNTFIQGNSLLLQDQDQI